MGMEDGELEGSERDSKGMKFGEVEGRELPPSNEQVQCWRSKYLSTRRGTHTGSVCTLRTSRDRRRLA